MARGPRPRPPCRRNYGIPLYVASFVPFDEILKQKPGKAENEDGAENAGSSETSPPATGFPILVGGGGGDSRSGIPNALVLAEFDFASASLSESPVHRHGTGKELPYRIAVHPSGEGLVCAFPDTCKWFEWDVGEGGHVDRLAIKPSEKLLTPLQDAGQQLALGFNLDGSMLAAGSENGHLKVLKWPSMEFIIDRPDAHDTVKDLDFSSDGELLVSLGGSACRVWDPASSTVVANLSAENGERFGFCRFSRFNNDRLLYVTAVKGDQGGIVTWNTTSWKRIRTKVVVCDSISAFSLSGDGKFLAIGTGEGNIVIVNSATMQVNKLVKKAHLGPVTALTFSHDSRALLSTSFDSSAMVTIIQHKKQFGISTWIIFFFIIVVAILSYIVKDGEALLYLCPHIKKGEGVGTSQI